MRSQIADCKASHSKKEHTWSSSSETCGSVNVFPGRLVRPSRRMWQMHKEVASCFRRWHSGDVQIDGLLPTRDSYPSSPTRPRLQQVDLNNLNPLRWVEAFLTLFVSELFERTDEVLLCSNDPVIGRRRKKSFESMHMKRRRCGLVMHLVIGMQSRSRAPQEGLP